MTHPQVGRWTLATVLLIAAAFFHHSVAAQILEQAPSATTGLAKQGSEYENPHGPVQLIRAGRASGLLTIDGRLVDEPWQSVPVTSDFHQLEPTEGAAPTET